ncbi:hypothetical protein ABIC65_000245 [Sphingomonas trueperi]|uniref:hypothetical protein n=1 Tax=Sphingomonas trueperi TaxID=53317 RepID=UPI003396ED65
MKNCRTTLTTTLLGIGLALSAPAVAQNIAQDDNADMQMLFKADQAVRSGIRPEQFTDRAFVTKMIAEDQERRLKVRKLLDSGALRSGDDYYAAAYVFQHGSTADDYLLAHSLALAAVANGKKDATWIAAATLDRYLQKIGQKQIYGTQFISVKATGPTMEPYDRTLVPDGLRKVLGVPERKLQDERLEKMKITAPATR